MNAELIKYFQDGITIDKLPNGKFSVFTFKTKRFVVDSLEDLTPDAFENALTAAIEKEKIDKEAIAEFHRKKMEELQPVEQTPSNYTLDYFSSILTIPKSFEFTCRNGKTVNVGSLFTLSIGTTTYDVYLDSIDVNRKKESQSIITFINAATGDYFVLCLDQINKSVTDFKLK